MILDVSNPNEFAFTVKSLDYDLSLAGHKVAQGERSMCNWDEDSLTMAVAASRDCLTGIDKSGIDGLYLASTTLPFADRQNAGIAATALNLKSEILTADFTASTSRSRPS